MQTIKKILRLVITVSLIMAAGQIPVGKGTVGSWLIAAVSGTCVWATNEVKQTKFMAGFKLPAPIERWLETITQTTKEKTSKIQNKDEKAETGDDLSTSDLDAAVRLLE